MALSVLRLRKQKGLEGSYSRDVSERVGYHEISQVVDQLPLSTKVVALKHAVATPNALLLPLCIQINSLSTN
jgi:hypothetical protein